MGEAGLTRALLDKVLSDEFWRSEGNRVLCAPAQLQHKMKLEQWLKTKNSLSGHLFFQTSGSSGTPKWVAISKAALLHSAQTVNAHLGISSQHKHLLAIPIYHVGGFGLVARAYASGGTVDVYEGRWDARSFVATVESCGSQVVSLVPTQVVDLVRNGLKAPKSLSKVVVGGGNLSDEIYDEARDLDWPLFRSYGMSEASSQIATGDDGDYWLRVLDGWGLKLNNEGLLQIKGAAMFSGYLIENEQGYQLERPFDSEGWFTTQDVVELDHERLRFIKRCGRMVKVLGELVDLDDIEHELSQDLAREVVIVAVPNERRGSELVAVVAGEMVELPMRWSRGLTAISQVYEFEQLPRSPLGKISRAKALEWVLARIAGDKQAE